MQSHTATPDLRLSASSRPRVRLSWLLPPLTEVVFASMLLWLIAGGNPSVLLADGDTGWHIRTGEWILTHGRFPVTDLFSFSRPGAEWFAWEWMSDVLFAVLFRLAGLPGVVLFAAILIAGTSAALFRVLIWQGSNIIVSVLVMFAAGSASTVHWLARPHLFTYLLSVLCFWLLESDRRRPSRRVWLLALLAALWTNLHGGFLILIAAVVIYCAGSLAGRDWAAARRYASLAAASAGATLLNPYTYHLHTHIARYLSSDFIRNQVEEFQSPRFRGESMAVYEVLLVGGLLAIPRLWKRGGYAPALLLLGLAHASLGSVRHVLIYVLAAGPILAGQVTEILAARRDPWSAALLSLSPGAPAGDRPRFWPPFWALGAVVVCALLLHSGRPRWQADFPREKFPHAALAAVEKTFVSERIFTSDQWADYLIFRYYPHIRVFIDGRSDFYGAAVGRQYLEAVTASHGWEKIFDHNGFDVALLPAGWPLATVLKMHPSWRLEYDDGQALMLRKVSCHPCSSANPN